MNRPVRKIPEAFGDALVIYTIYNSPLDYPGKFVVRAIYSGGNLPPGFVALDQNDCTVRDTLEEARCSVPLGLARMPALSNDDMCIEEVWL